MKELKRVHFRPQPNGNFVLEGYTSMDFYIERELKSTEIESSILTEGCLEIRFKNGKEYRIWFHDIDFGKASVPMYIRRGYLLKADVFHALYALAAEVSHYAGGFSSQINRDYLMNTKELSQMYASQDVEVIIKTLLEAAGVKEEAPNTD